MDNDDLPVGRVLGRREALRLIALGGSAAAWVACRGGGTTRDSSAGEASLAPSGAGAQNTATMPGCVVRPELTEGPYFVPQQPQRSDLRSEPGATTLTTGVPLTLTFNVSQLGTGACRPLAGALVDVWHCDAEGVYSGVADGQMGFDTTGKHFLRGFQVTDANGVARFTTIYPGWYRGRAVHVHFKIRTDAPSRAVTGAPQSYEFTSQLFFDDALSDRVFTRAPYAGKGARDMRNSDDGIYRESNGQLLLAVAQSGESYDAKFDIGLDLSDAKAGAADHDGGPGRPGGRRPGGPPPGGRPGGPPPPRQRS